jgi:hypothetical protein
LIITWARVRQLTRERFSEDDEAAASDAVEVAEAAACEAAQERMAAEEVKAAAREVASQEEVDEDDVDGLEGFDDEAAEAVSEK